MLASRLLTVRKLSRRSMRTLLLTLACVLLITAPLTQAQTTDANLVGTVLDATGAGVPNATVDATNTSTGVKYTTKTEPSGTYRLNNLPVGGYDITATGTGF